MTITKLSAVNYSYINRATYYFYDGSVPTTKEIQKTSGEVEPNDGKGYLLQYSYFDFLKFDDTTITGELFEQDDLFLLKVAIPHTCSYVNLSYSTSSELNEGIGVIRLTLSETREKTYDTIASVYSSETSQVELENLEVKIHETNYSNPHKDQVVRDLYRAPAGAIIVNTLTNGLTTRYRAVPFGNFIVTEDGCKYWMGNFTTNLNGVEP